MIPGAILHAVCNEHFYERVENFPPPASGLMKNVFSRHRRQGVIVKYSGAILYLINRMCNRRRVQIARSLLDVWDVSSFEARDFME